MYTQNLHTHGVLCDGKDEYENTVLRAIELGLTSIGFSGHSYTPYASGFCMTPERTAEYKAEIARLKKKFKDQIEIFCGLEFDMYSSDDLQGYDYCIGTVHYLKNGDNYIAIDRSADHVEKVINEHFCGDGLKYAKEYYAQLADLPKYGKFDLVGHFDIITKHSEKRAFFDEDSAEYRKYALDCLYALMEKIKVFEVNTGAIARGYRTTPYPNPFILKEIKNIGCGVTLGSDCHDNRYLTHYFGEAIKLLKSCGFTEAQVLTKDGFRGVKI